VADDAVPVLLGENWAAAVPFMQILALANIVQALTASCNYALIVLDAFRASVAFVWTQVLFLAALALTVFFGSNAPSSRGSG
jgi:O-antigen/teichoic acid export membrane protein